MSARLRGFSLATAAFACALALAHPSAAHVALDTPKSGVTLAVGSKLSITWEDTILHEGIGYDLDLIGADRQIQSPIAHDLPTTLHSYDWAVPDIWCVGCVIMVTQVNRGQDYIDGAAVNIYGTPAAGGSPGAGGSPNAQGGASTTHAGMGSASGPGMGGTGGTGEAHAAGGSSGTSPLISGGVAGGGAPASSRPHAGTSSGGSGNAVETTESAAGAIESAGGSAGTDADVRGAAEDAAGAADEGVRAAQSGGCALNSHAPPSFGAELGLATLAVVLAGRKRRVARNHG